MSDLDILFPERVLTLGQETVEVKPFRFGDFKKVLAILDEFIEIFSSDPETWVQTLLGSGEEAVEALATLTLFSVNRDRDWLNSLEGDLALDLFFKVFEVNADFFVRKLTTGATLVANAIQKAGQSSPPALSPQVTDGQKSKTIRKAS
jgi:hypothetical protein